MGPAVGTTALAEIIRLALKATATLLALIIAGSSSDVGATDDSAPPPRMQSAKDLFTDQPKGLSDHIIAWKLIYYGETLGNLSGGLAQGAIYEGMAKLGVGVNLEKLAGLEEGVFYMDAIYPHGNSVTQKYIGDFNTVSNIDTTDGIRLYKLWLQKAFDDEKWSVRVGQIAADKECFVSDGASVYLNNAFGTSWRSTGGQFSRVARALPPRGPIDAARRTPLGRRGRPIGLQPGWSVEHLNERA